MIASASFAACGPIIFAGFNTAAQILHPESNPIVKTVSFLVFGSYGWLQTTAFYILGISLFALAAALFLRIKTRFNLGAILVLLIGIAFLLVAANPVQTPGTILTTSEIIHRDAAVSIVVMSPLVCFILAHSLRMSGYKKLWRYSVATGIITILVMIIGALIPTANSNYLGIFERILLLNGQIWGEVMCIGLVWTALKTKQIQTNSHSNDKELLYNEN